jgi:hypothetical protein
MLIGRLASNVLLSEVGGNGPVRYRAIARAGDAFRQCQGHAFLFVHEASSKLKS